MSAVPFLCGLRSCLSAVRCFSVNNEHHRPSETAFEKKVDLAIEIRDEKGKEVSLSSEKEGDITE